MAAKTRKIATPTTTTCALTMLEWLRVERALAMAGDLLDAAKWPYSTSANSTLSALEDERAAFRDLRYKIANQRIPTP